MSENYSCILPFLSCCVRIFRQGCARNSVGRAFASIKPVTSVTDSAHGCAQYLWLAEGTAKAAGKVELQLS